MNPTEETQYHPGAVPRNTTTELSTPEARAAVEGRTWGGALQAGSGGPGTATDQMAKIMAGHFGTEQTGSAEQQEQAAAQQQQVRQRRRRNPAPSHSSHDPAEKDRHSSHAVTGGALMTPDGRSWRFSSACCCSGVLAAAMAASAAWAASQCWGEDPASHPSWCWGS